MRSDKNRTGKGLENRSSARFVSSRMTTRKENTETTLWWDNDIRNRNMIPLLGITTMVVVIILVGFVSAWVIYGLQLEGMVGPMIAIISFPLLVLVMGVVFVARSPKRIGVGQESLILEFVRKRIEVQWSEIEDIVETRKPIHPIEIRRVDGSWIVLSAVSREIVQNIREIHSKSQMAKGTS
jgi:hypothetical protein